MDWCRCRTCAWVLTVKVSQKLEYACRAAVCLARHYDGATVVKLEDIAQQEDISASFLVQILNELKRFGLVDSKRGKAGGERTESFYEHRAVPFIPCSRALPR